MGDFVTWTWSNVAATRVYQTNSAYSPLTGGFEYAETSTTGKRIGLNILALPSRTKCMRMKCVYGIN